jgi:hypothetical protein
MNTNALIRFSALMFAALSLVWTGCNAINNSVEDALKTTKFELEPIDDLAATILGDSSIAHNYFKADTAASVDTTGGRYTFTCPNDTVISITLAAYPAAVDSIIDMLAANQASIAVFDTAYKVTTGTPKIAAFAFQPGSYQKVVFYITDYVNVSIEDADGNLVSPRSLSIPVELSSSCYRYNTSTKKPEPIIKVRAEYELTSGKYLFKITRTDQTLSRTFYLAILGE